MAAAAVNVGRTPMTPTINAALGLSCCLALAGCADFAEGMRYGAASQQAYMDRQADPFGTYLADLPASPERIGRLPAPEYYRCTDQGRSFDYAFHHGEWYHKGWRERQWSLLACNQGERRITSYAYASSTCGDNGRKFWNITTITSRDGMTISKAEVDRETLLFTTSYSSGGSARTIRSSCKEIEG